MPHLRRCETSSRKTIAGVISAHGWKIQGRRIGRPDERIMSTCNVIAEVRTFVAAAPSACN